MARSLEPYRLGQTSLRIPAGHRARRSHVDAQVAFLPPACHLAPCRLASVGAPPKSFAHLGISPPAVSMFRRGAEHRSHSNSLKEVNF